MRVSAPLAALLICATAPASVSAQTPRYGYVDVERVLNGTQDGIRAWGRLRRVFRERQADLDRRRAELLELRDSFRRRLCWLGMERTMLARYTAAGTTLLHVYNAYQGELRGLEVRLRAPIRRRIAGVILRLMAEGYMIAADDEGLMRPLYVEDLTGLVIARYESARR